jgi:hypothetical protein
MEAVSPSDWDLQRPNLVSWATDLDAIPTSRPLVTARGQIFELGRRFDVLSQPPLEEEDEVEFAEEEAAPVASSMPPPPLPSQSQHSVRRSAQDDVMVVNEPSVSVLV